MFALLVGALSGIGFILRDLNEPFGNGPFRITPSMTHLASVRRLLNESLCAEGRMPG
jgi:hypothetical protein